MTPSSGATSRSPGPRPGSGWRRRWGRRAGGPGAPGRPRPGEGQGGRARRSRPPAPRLVVEVHRCDIGDLDDVRRFVDEFRSGGGRLDVLVHNAGVDAPRAHRVGAGARAGDGRARAGAGADDRAAAPDAARERRAARPARHLGRDVQPARCGPTTRSTSVGDYSPTTAYARSKRAQVELLPVLQQRWGPRALASGPRTPAGPARPEWPSRCRGSTSSRGPVLRDADGGADTTVWLAATEPAPPAAVSGTTGGSDRPTSCPSTRTRPGDIERMWAWVAEQTGVTR